jgi:hypothetical protein
VRIAVLANERFVLFYREGWSRHFDVIMGMCSGAGFSPRVEYEADRVQTAVSRVEAEESVSAVSAKVRMFWSNGVRFYLLRPDDMRVELVAAWKQERPSVVFGTFLNLVNTNAWHIRKKTEFY